MCTEAVKRAAVQRFRACESSRQVATAATTAILLSPFRHLPVTTGGVGHDGVTPDGIGGVTGKRQMGGWDYASSTDLFMLARLPTVALA